MAIAKLRIIAGKFKGRKIGFDPTNTSLRPTLNRVRETAFNWLAPYIFNKNCLDLFAGSGIFGFEALSRGAKVVWLVEKNYNSYCKILENQTKLGLSATVCKVVNQDVRSWLQQAEDLKLAKDCEVIFLDPPYDPQQGLLLTTLKLLIEHNWLSDGSKVYFECNWDLTVIKLPNFLQDLKILKTSHAGQVYFYLAEYIKNN